MLHLIRAHICFWLASAVAAAVLAFPPHGHAAEGNGFHGAAILKNPFNLSDPLRRSLAHVGDTIQANIRVRNLDDFNDSLTITSIVDTIRHAQGASNVTTPNLLSAPTNLPLFGNSVTVSNNYPVLPEDGDILLDDAQAAGLDNHDGDNGTFLPQSFFITFPGQLQILRPCLQIAKSCNNSVGETGQITWTGLLRNCSNSSNYLYNVVVSNFVSGAWARVFPAAVLTNGQSYATVNSTTTISNALTGQTYTFNITPNPSGAPLVITLTNGETHVVTSGDGYVLINNEVVTIRGSYPGGCLPTTDTLVASSTDELGLTVLATNSATCSNLITTGVSVTKECPANPVQPNSFLTFSGVVSNTGNVTLTNVVVVNNQPANNTPVVAVTRLAPGEFRAFTGSYRTAPDACGPWNDTLTVTAVSTCGVAVTNSASRSCPAINTPAIVVTKSCPPAPVGPGQLLVFSGTVSNAGNITLTNVVVVNNQPSNNTPVFVAASLAPGEVRAFTGSYRTPPDTCGPYLDTLMASGRDKCFGVLVTSSSTRNCPGLTTPRIYIQKFCPPEPTPFGGLLFYSGIVSNAGDITLLDVGVFNNKPFSNTLVLGPIDLAPGQFIRFTNSYRVSGSDCCGPYPDTLLAMGTDKCTGSNVVKTSTAVCPGITFPSLNITRTCPTNPVVLGQPIPIGGIVSNSGNVTLSNVVVIDNNGQVIMNMQGFGIAEWMDYAASFVITNCGPTGFVTNTITITGNDICNGARVSASATCIINCAGGQPLVIVGPKLLGTKFGLFVGSPGTELEFAL